MHMTPSSFSAWIDALTQSGLCPFAKPAVQAGKVVLIPVTEHLWEAMVLAANDPYHPDIVVVLSFDTSVINLEIVERLVELANDAFPDFLFLYTHPDMDEPSHPTFGLVFIQRKSEMLQAVEKLKAAGYYANRELPEWIE